MSPEFTYGEYYVVKAFYLGHLSSNVTLEKKKDKMKNR